MCQKWEGDCGLWVLNEIFKNKYTESFNIEMSESKNTFLKSQKQFKAPCTISLDTFIMFSFDQDS